MGDEETGTIDKHKGDRVLTVYVFLVFSKQMLIRENRTKIENADILRTLTIKTLTNWINIKNNCSVLLNGQNYKIILLIKNVTR